MGERHPRSNWRIGRSRRQKRLKKKELSPESSFEKTRAERREWDDQTPIIFFPPESMGSASDLMDSTDEDNLQSLSAWDVAARYHEFKNKPHFKKIAHHLREISVAAVLEKARQVLGSVVHPVEPHSAPLKDVPPHAIQVDFDLEESIENQPLLARGEIDYDQIWMSYELHRSQPVVLAVDTSLSMTGEKLALTAVALAVVLLQFPEDQIGIIAFENHAQILKLPDERLTIGQLIERFLDVPAQGYTHLEEGMLAAVKLVEGLKGKGRPASTVLVTDGKYTAGRDPAYLAFRFPHLVVLKMGGERSSLPLCEELARLGHGLLKEVPHLEALPSVMYSAVKDLLRGHSESQ